MIPKVIHCCWLGDREKDALSRRCRASWERFAPECAVREWNLAEIERAGGCLPPFVLEALSRRKWAFAADWVRFFALEREGGVYFDCDFELQAPIGDLVAQGPFVAEEWRPDGSIGLGPAILALEKGSLLARAMLAHYETAAFDGHTTVGEIMASLPAGTVGALRTLPPEVFSPIDVQGVCHRTAATRGIHHYAMSWASPSRRVAKWLSWHGLRGLVDILLKIPH